MNRSVIARSSIARVSLTGIMLPALEKARGGGLVRASLILRGTLCSVVGQTQSVAGADGGLRPPYADSLAGKMSDS
jgi:hypothetical protein